MAMLEIKKFQDKVLKKSAKTIRKTSDELKQLALDMAETMYEANGVGLAANQVGVLKRLIVVAFEDGPIALVNPRIVKKSSEKEIDSEGCLSFPLLYGDVERHCFVKIAAQDLEMNPVKFEMEGFMARVFQHEIDHLNGVTFVERVEQGTLRKVDPLEEKAREEAEDAAAEAEGAAPETEEAAGKGAAE